MRVLAMAAFGAELTIVPSEGGRITKALITTMIETAKEISRRTGAYWTTSSATPGAHLIEGIGIGGTSSGGSRPATCAATRRSNRRPR